MTDLVVHDVGMRDGLQVETMVVPTERKIAWIRRLIDAGVDLVQVGSFVNPKFVPQMSDTDVIFRHLSAGGRPARTRLSALVLNERGLERGLAVGVEYFCMGVSASETHSRKNTGMGTAEAMDRILRMARDARAAGAAVQLSVQSAFGCGYEGHIPESRVIEIASAYVDAGFTTVSLADTAGHATPDRVQQLFGTLRKSAPTITWACHFHDTYGMAMANAWAALDVGVQLFEAAFGGLGGCPFTAVAGVNLCTEDFVHLAQRMGRCAGIALDPLVELARDAERVFDRPLPGVIHRMGPIPSTAGVV